VLRVWCLQEEWRGEIEQLSWKPRAFLAKGFLSDEECEHIKNMVRVGPNEGREQLSNLPQQLLLGVPA
jgi:hypothetical protein